MGISGCKIEPNESLEACLIREIKEELDITISIQKPLLSVTHHYPDFSLVLYPFLCKIVSGIPTAKEHKQLQWVNKTEFIDFDFAEADLPILKEL